MKKSPLVFVSLLLFSCSLPDFEDFRFGNSSGIDPYHMMTFAIVPHVTAIWHTDALRSGHTDFFGEGCVVRVSTSTVQEIGRLAQIGRIGARSHSRANKFVLFTIFSSDGAIFEFGSVDNIQNQEGENFLIDRVTSTSIYNIAASEVHGLSCAPNF